MQKFITIERHILEQQARHPDATGTLTNILYDMALAGKIIARETSRAGLAQDILGTAGTVNPTGDDQYHLDVFAHDVIFKMNDHTGRLCVMASEEHEDIVPIPAQFESGNYVLIFDPLDGSSNINVNVSVGTIFGIYKKISRGDRGVLEDCLQPGRNIVAAGYMTYGSSTMMIYSAGNGVHGFTLDPGVGEFLLSHPNIRMPEKPKYYSVNQGNEREWSEGIKKYVKWLQGIVDEGEEPPPATLSQRYIGSLVTDFHRNLLTGGVYVYPGNLARPDGKLRLLYENIPLAYLAEQAGGYASDGESNILDIKPYKLHQRSPLFIGDKTLVKKAEKYLHKYDQDWLEAYLKRRDKPTG